MKSDKIRKYGNRMASKVDKIVEDAPGKRLLLMGNEAIARGAIEAGVGLAASYPGTPSSEILETLALAAPKLGFHAQWSTNEKVAFEVAAGAAITGVRAITSLKNAGLNWVMDMFMTLVYSGVRGGLVIAVADDPDAHYSSNEQDTRFAAQYAEIPCLEPSNVQEAREMARYAFELSEELELPVFLRTVTRISHASGDVELGKIERSERKPVFDKHWKVPWRWNVYGPPGPVEKHRWLHGQMPKIKAIVETLPWNKLDLKEGQSHAVVASGIGASYAMDAIKILGLEESVAFLKVGTPTPMPKKLVERLLKFVKKVVVIEEGEPFIELQMKEMAKDFNPEVEILGRLSGCVPQVGEINIDVASKAIANMTGKNIVADEEMEKTKKEIEKILAPRSSTLCAGCPHLGSYWALRMVLHKAGKVPIVNGDIGCYEQGGYGLAGKEYKPSFSSKSVKYSIEAPYEILDTNYIMGGGIGVMQGQFFAGYMDGSVIAVAGDSTFFHACIPAVINAVYNKAKGVFLVLDNSWTAMTGHQPNPVTGETATGEKAKVLCIEDIVRALGVEVLKVVDSFDLKGMESALEEVLKSDKFAVVVSRGVCTLQAQRLKQYHGKRMIFDKDKCTACKLCVGLGCPAITFSVEEKKAGIDPILCVGCGLCAQVCPVDAIRIGE